MDGMIELGNKMGPEEERCHRLVSMIAGFAGNLQGRSHESGQRMDRNNSFLNICSLTMRTPRPKKTDRLYCNFCNGIKESVHETDPWHYEKALIKFVMSQPLEKGAT